MYLIYSVLKLPCQRGESSGSNNAKYNSSRCDKRLNVLMVTAGATNDVGDAKTSAKISENTVASCAAVDAS